MTPIDKPWGEEVEGLVLQRRSDHAPDWREIADALAEAVHQHAIQKCEECNAVLRRYQEAGRP